MQDNIKDGKKNKVLNKQINSKINITMIHGQKDDVVPVSYSRKILKIFKASNSKLIVVAGAPNLVDTNILNTNLCFVLLVCVVRWGCVRASLGTTAVRCVVCGESFVWYQARIPPA